MALDDNILDAGQFRGNQENFQPIPEDYLVHNGVRLANYLLDYFVRLGFVIILSGIYEFYNDFLEIPFSEDLLASLFLISWLLYYPTLEYFYGKTFGKMLTKTSVVRVDGHKITFLQAIGRSLCRMIPFEMFSFLGSRSIGWHDDFSNTRVVKDAFLVHHRRYLTNHQ